MFSNFASGGRKRIYVCFVRGEKNDVLLHVVRLAEGTWDSIIAVIGDGAKSELAGVGRISILPL